MNKAYIICGSPASGKTTYGKELAKEHNAVFLDIDITTERLIQVALIESGYDKNDRDSEYFKNTYREVIYETMFDIAKVNLQWNDVVIVGPFTRELKIKSWPKDLSLKLNSEVEVHYVYCNKEERFQRMKQRNNDRDISKLENWEKFNIYYGEEKPPKFEHIFVDTSNKINNNLV